MKLLHKIVSWFGFSLGGYKWCVKYGCKTCCSSSPCENMLFMSAKENRLEKLLNDVNKRATT